MINGRPETWGERVLALRRGIDQVQRELKRRQLDDHVSPEEQALLTDAVRHAIGLQRALWRVADRVLPAGQPAGLSAR